MLSSQNSCQGICIAIQQQAQFSSDVVAIDNAVAESLHAGSTKSAAIALPSAGRQEAEVSMASEHKSSVIFCGVHRSLFARVTVLEASAFSAAAAKAIFCALSHYANFAAADDGASEASSSGLAQSAATALSPAGLQEAAAPVASEPKPVASLSPAEPSGADHSTLPVQTLPVVSVPSETASEVAPAPQVQTAYAAAAASAGPVVPQAEQV